MSFNISSSATRSNQASFPLKATWTPYIHFIEPELAGVAAPRVAHLTKRAITYQWFLWSMLVATIALFCFLGERDYATWNGLLRHGIVTQATPYSKLLTYSSSHSTQSSYVLYRFKADSVTDTFSHEANPKEYDALRKGQKIPVTYLPGTRGQIWQEGLASPRRRDVSVAAWALGILLDSVFWGLFISVAINTNKRQLRLLREGVAVPCVASAPMVLRRGNTRRYRIEYAYWTGGEKRTGEMILPEAQHQQIVSANRYFTVLYDVNSPSEHLPYFQITEARLAAATQNK